MKSSHSNIISEHFAERSKNYNENGTWVNNSAILQQMFNYLPENLKGTSILDLGSGTGAVCNYILTQVDSDIHVTAVDNCAEMIGQIHNPSINRILADATNLPFLNESFSCVVSRQCLHYVEELEVALNEIHRVLQRGGVFVLAQIIPFDEETKEYWRRIIEIRQPLRKWYYSSEDWICKCRNSGFSLCENTKLSHQSSVQKWIKKYDVKDNDQIAKLRSSIVDSGEEFKRKYNVIITEDDVLYSAFWFIGKFIKL